MFRKALRNVAQARQMARVARDAGVTRESLYRATSEIGNPTLDTLDSVLSAVGIKMKFEAEEISVKPVEPTISARSHSGYSRVYDVEVNSSLIPGIETVGCRIGAPLNPANLTWRSSGMLYIGKEYSTNDILESAGLIAHHDVGPAANQVSAPSPLFVPHAQPANEPVIAFATS
jgi:hypothetical protein